MANTGLSTPQQTGERDAWLLHFAGAFENAVIGMTLMDTDGRRLTVNHALCAFLGYTEAELIGQLGRHVVHPDDLAQDLVELDALRAGTRDSYRRIKRYIHKQGHVLWGDFSCTMVRDLKGHALFFINQVQDITERRQAEERLHDTQAMLRLAAQVGRLGAWAYDVDATSLRWSPEVCAIFGAPPDATPTIQDAMKFVVPSYHEVVRATLEDCLRGGSPFDIEIEVFAARHQRLWVRLICEAEWDAQGQVCRLQGALQDVSQAKEAEHEILRLNGQLEERVSQRTAQLQEANRELEAFSYSVAHDLRAPLSSIDGFSNALQANAQGALDEKSLHYLQRIRAGVRQMSECTDGLLSLASVSRTDLQVRVVDIAALANAALVNCRERTPGRAITVVVAATLPARGDPRLLALALQNLLDNAWKFTARQPQPRIEVGGISQGDDGHEVYFVRDNGAGFDMTYASRMFEAFQRMHATHEFEGTGIGLAIAQRVIARHGGRIWAESVPGCGATFYFTLG